MVKTGLFVIVLLNLSAAEFNFSLHRSRTFYIFFMNTTFYLMNEDFFLQIFTAKNHTFMLVILEKQQVNYELIFQKLHARRLKISQALVLTGISINLRLCSVFFSHKGFETLY